MRVGILIGAEQAWVLLETRFGQRVTNLQHQVAVGDGVRMLGQHGDQGVAESAVRLRVVARRGGIGGGLITLTPTQQNAGIWTHALRGSWPQSTVTGLGGRRVHGTGGRRVARGLIRRLRIQLRFQELGSQPGYRAHQSSLIRTCAL